MWRNSTVWLVGSALALLGSGCIVNEHVDSGGPGYHSPPPPVAVASGARLSVAWDLAYVGGKPADCETADTPTVNIRLDPAPNGTPYAIAFPCEGGAALATGIDPGTYEVSLDLVDTRGRVVASQTHPPVRFFFDTTTQLEEPALLPVQTWDLAWSVGHRGPRELSCEEVGAASVEFSAQFEGETRETYLLPCNDYNALTTAIRPGDYAVRMLLLDRAGRAIGDTGLGLFTVTLDAAAALDADFDL